MFLGILYNKLLPLVNIINCNHKHVHATTLVILFQRVFCMLTFGTGDCKTFGFPCRCLRSKFGALYVFSLLYMGSEDFV